ncbi:sensor histidine kinase [Lacrimispora brassicae]
MKKVIKRLLMTFSHFQAKLLLAFLLCTFIPLSVIGCISYAVSYSIARDKIVDSAILAADQLHVQLNSRIRQAENVADTIQYNMYTLGKSSGQELSARLEELTSLRNNISLYKSTFNFYHICIFLKDEQLGSGEGLFFYPISAISGYGLSFKELNHLGASSLWFYQPQVKLPLVLDHDEPPSDAVICCRAMVNQGSKELEYAYFIMMSTQEFSDMLTASFSNTEISCFLFTPEGTLAAGSEKEMEGQLLNSGRDLISSPDGKSYYEKNGDCYYVLPLENGWHQITVIPQSYIAGGTAVLLRTILMALLLSLPLTALIILLISRNLSKRVMLLSKAMEEFRLSADMKAQKHFPLPKDESLYDEIDHLGLAFEQMQATIRQNVRSILDLSLKEERLKYQLLQSQINPHFLYNILGSVNTCQSLGRLDTASRMITDLTRFYRLTLSKSGDRITIRDEIEIATLYLNMEKLCHSSGLSWETDLEDGIENFLICKFTLQPFLENSILHGLSNRTPNLFIRIQAVYGDDTVIIRIKDNGAGIPEEKLNELKQDLERKTVNYEKHFGILNVNARISSELYGCGHIEIDSKPYQGTCITITFAQIEGDLE